jgi:uncharacterized membrane protein YfcA
MPVDFPWALCILAFVLGGTVKGALGVGLPLVAVPMLSLWIPPAQAIALLIAPVLISNLWQAVDGGRWRTTLRRFKWLMLAQMLATVATVRMTLALSPNQLNVMLALAILLAVALMALKPTLRVTQKQEGVVGIGVGLFSGLMGGVSSLTGPVIITYLMSLKLDRDTFVGSISIIYLTGAFPLYVAMFAFHHIGAVEFGLSVAALAPMAVGLWLGKALRQRLNEQVFQRILLVFLTLLAATLLVKSAWPQA